MPFEVPEHIGREGDVSGGDPFKNLSGTWLAGGEKGELPEDRGQCCHTCYTDIYICMCVYRIYALHVCAVVCVS